MPAAGTVVFPLERVQEIELAGSAAVAYMGETVIAHPQWEHVGEECTQSVGETVADV